MGEKTLGQIAEAANSEADEQEMMDTAQWQFIAHAVRTHVLEEAAQIAHRLTDDETRRALGANAVIVASQIENAIRALAKDGAE